MSPGEPVSGRASRRSPMSSSLHFTNRGRWVQRLRLSAAVAVLAAIALIGVALPTVVLPETQPVPGGTDAVVLLANGAERYATAQRVVPRGDAELVVVVGSLDDQPDVAAHCDTSADGYDVTCLDDAPGDLRGRARQLAATADREGWDDLTVMTATYEVSRARMLFERCVGTEVEMISTATGLGPLGWTATAAGELLALVRDGWFHRGC